MTMNIQWIGRVVLLLLCLAPVASHAETSVWKVSGDGNHLYLGGTIHILNKADFPLPRAFQSAYNKADMVVLETDMAVVRSPEFQRKILLQTTYSGDGSIIQDLSDDTVKLLRNHLEQRGIPPPSLFRFKAGMLSVTLTVLELQHLGFTEAGVDEFFWRQALEDNKKLGYLESADEQIEFLVNMGKGHEDELIRQSIMEVKKLPEYMHVLREGWRQGDMEQLEAVGLEPWVDQFPELYDTLLLDRNRNWIPEIEHLLETADVELVLFGALHLVGEDGILALLEERGYRIEQLD
ncbi:TraB/GumN family protein [Marinobacter lacisalsi]|uniref:TraB/GumN family protein n=1 Tax=Marinobacter lacisalsi TaxID=475979 RepID=A0ABV8QGD0_9GAMM